MSRPVGKLVPILCLCMVTVACEGNDTDDKNADTHTSIPAGSDGTSNGDGDGTGEGSENHAGTDEQATAGNGLCEAPETPISTPADCPAKAGDGYCSHTENAAQNPDDCVATQGDGYCTGNETPITSPVDCPAVANDGLCSHNESAATTPADCPVQAGDGACTHDETPLSSADDCPAVAGDGYCSHEENASTTPQDCPAVSGDGFCTHTESFPADRGDCRGPSFTTGAGDTRLSDLLAVSPTLQFDELIINSRISLYRGERLATIVARRVQINKGAGFRYFWGSERRGAPTSLRFIVEQEFEHHGTIDLVGSAGRPSTFYISNGRLFGGPDDGGIGGSLVVKANTIVIDGEVNVQGGNADRTTFIYSGGNYSIGGDGGAGGTIKLNAAVSIYTGGGLNNRSGRPNTGTQEGGRWGSHGKTIWNAPLIQAREGEDNGVLGLAYGIAGRGLTLFGKTGRYDNATPDSMGTFLTYTDATGADGNIIEDLFIFNVPEAGTYTFKLAPTWRSADSIDLDLMLIDIGVTKFLSNPVTTSGAQEFTVDLYKGQYYLAVSFVGVSGLAGQGGVYEYKVEID